MMMVITSLIVSPLSRWRCFLPSLNRGCWAFNSGKVPWQNSSQSTKSCTMSISVLLFVVGTSGANLSRFLPKKESRDSTTELISLLCFNFYIELTFHRGDDLGRNLLAFGKLDDDAISRLHEVRRGHDFSISRNQDAGTDSRRLHKFACRSRCDLSLDGSHRDHRRFHLTKQVSQLLGVGVSSCARTEPEQEEQRKLTYRLYLERFHKPPPSITLCPLIGRLRPSNGIEPRLPTTRCRSGIFRAAPSLWRRRRCSRPSNLQPRCTATPSAPVLSPLSKPSTPPIRAYPPRLPPLYSPARFLARSTRPN